MATQEQLVEELRELKIKMAWLEINDSITFKDVEKINTESWLSKMEQIDDTINPRICHIIEHLTLELNLL